MFNFKSPNFKKLGLDADGLKHDRLIDLMLAEPRLIKRPVVVLNGVAYFGATKKVLEQLPGLV